VWTEFAAHRGDVMIEKEEPQNPSKLVVAATCEIAKTCFLSTGDMNPTLTN
jgi:hypothetical protein